MAEASIQSRTLLTVSAAGTPVRFTSTQTDPAAELKCNEIQIQPLKALGAAGAADTENSGVIYMLNSSTAKGASSSNIVARLDIGQPARIFRAPKPYAFNLADFYLDAQTSGDGALISWC